MDDKCIVTKLPHHVQQKLCQTRSPYRQGKRLTSVKVYTVNDESKHLMMCGVPKLRLGEEIRKVVEPYGIIKKIHVVPDYPAEEFTETYYVQYDRVQNARIAKRFVDGKNFYGGSLHVFYAPELETVSETKAKLLQRRRDVLVRINRNRRDVKNRDTDKFIPKEQYHRRRRTPALPLTEERLTRQYPGETLSSIYNGIPRSLDPRPVSEPGLPSTSRAPQENSSSTSVSLQTPCRPDAEAVVRNAGGTAKRSDHAGRKSKNYKGRSSVDDGVVKVRVVKRPRLVDTSTIVKWDDSTKNVFSNPKRIRSDITIRLIPKSDDEKKKIVIRDPSVSRLIRPSEDLRLSIEEAKSQIRSAMRTNDKDNS